MSRQNSPAADRKNDMTCSDASLDIIYLAGCICNGLAPSAQRVSEMDPEELHTLSLSLSLDSLVFTALERTPGYTLPDTDLTREWREKRDLEIYKSLMFDREWEKVRSFLEDSGIWYLLLKGLIIKGYYPEPGMRQMADIDVLIDPAADEQAHRWFLSQGYRAEIYRTGNHDSYLKTPFYNVELHRSLFVYPHEKAWCDYYADVRDRVILNDGSEYGHHFTDDDLYVYCTVHGCKHYSTGGTGLRTLLDNYVFLKAEKDKLDFEYIEAELKKLGIDDYERKLRTLAEKLFADPENFTPESLNEEELAFLSEFLDFGTYGTLDNRVMHRLGLLSGSEDTPTTAAKAKYIWKRLFPDVEMFKVYYPFFYRHRWLMPVGYVYRLVYKGITNRKKAAGELRSLSKKR